MHVKTLKGHQMDVQITFFSSQAAPFPSTTLLLGGCEDLQWGQCSRRRDLFSALSKDWRISHHSAPQAVFRTFISSEPQGVKRNLFFQKWICPLWPVMLLCIAWKSPCFTGEASLYSAFHFMSLLFFYRRDEKNLVRDVLGEAEKLLGKYLWIN